MTFVFKGERDVVGGGGGDAVHDGGEGARHGEGVGAVDKKSECRSIPSPSAHCGRSSNRSVSSALFFVNAALPPIAYLPFGTM